MRSEPLESLLSRPLTEEAKVLDAFVAALPSGEATPALFRKLHEAAAAQERAPQLSFAYERIARDARVKMLPKAKQAELFLAAASFFADTFSDAEAAGSYAERAYQAAPDDPQVFDEVETLLAGAQQASMLGKLYADKAAREKEPAEKLRLLNAAVDLCETEARPEELAPLLRQIMELDPSDESTIAKLEKIYTELRRFKELAEVLERVAAREDGKPSAAAEAARHRLIGLYRAELRDPAKAAPHVEALLALVPVPPAALQAAEALLDHRPIAPRIAPLLSEAYRRLGRFEDEASTLSIELKLAKPPRLAEVHRRLAMVRKDVLKDPAGALELLEPLVARDPTDDEIRRRYVEVTATFHREVEAARLLSRALGSVKDPAARIRVGRDIADLYASQGDEKKARSVLEPLLDEADDEQRFAIAKKLTELHGDAADPRGLAVALTHVVALEPEFPDRIGAGKRLVELAERAGLEPKFAIAGYRALIGSPRTDEALDKLEVLCTAARDDLGLLEVLEQRALRSKDAEASKKIALQVLELRVARTKDRAAALGLLKEFLRVHGPHRAVLEKRATLLEVTRDFPGLATTFEQLIELVPPREQAPLLARLARTRFTELKDRTGALAALASALSIDPKESSARRLAERMMGEGEHRSEAAALLEPAYRAEDNHTGVLRVLETRAELSPSPSVKLSSLEEAYALAKEQLGDARRALDIAGRALGLAIQQKAGTESWIERVRTIAEESGDPARVAAALAQGLGDTPIETAELATLGRETAEALVRAGEGSRAMETYRKVLAFDPANREVLSRIDELLAEQGTPEERLSLYRVALERAEGAERRRDLLRSIARIQQKDLGDVPAARETLEQLVKECPTDLGVHEALVEVYRLLSAHSEIEAELTRALGFLRGDRRSSVALALAREQAERGDEASALALFRELLETDSVPLDVLPRVSELAESRGDHATLAVVLERAATRLSDEGLQAALLEKLGDVRARDLGDPAAAVVAFRRARELQAERKAEESERRLFGKILSVAPDDAEAARALFESTVRSGQWTGAPALFSALLRNDASSAPVDLLLGLETRAIEAHAIEEFSALADLALRSPALGARARDVLVAKSRVLASDPSRRKEAFSILRSVVETHDTEGPLDLTDLFRHADPTDAADVRWLYQYRAERAADPLPILLEWANVEEYRFSDPAAAIRILEGTLAASPVDATVWSALSRLRLARKEPEALLEAQKLVRERLTGDEALEMDVRIASLLVEHLGQSDQGLALVRSVLERAPGHGGAIDVARTALGQVASRAEAARLLAEVADSPAGALGVDVLRALLDETRGTDLADARARWYALLLDAGTADPSTALSVAIEAAEEMPERAELWDRAERYARRARSAEPLAEAYQRALARPIGAELGEAIGRRFVDLHEEWFDLPDAVQKLLERILELSPRARWALDRVKLAYNAEGRWDDLFALYDRAIAGAVSDAEREDLLDEAALAAKDLANDGERAIRYLERLLGLRPDARVEGMLERLYERAGRSGDLLQLLKRRVTVARGPELRKQNLRLARLEIDVGELSSAFDRVQQALADDPDEAVAYELLERLASLSPAVSEVSSPVASQPPLSRKARSKKAPKAQIAAPPRNLAAEAIAIVEKRHRERNDFPALARVIELSARRETSPGQKVRLLEDLVSLCLERTGEAERAFLHLTELVEIEPESARHRERLAEVARRIGAEDRRAALLFRVAEGVSQRPAKIELLGEAASVMEAAGELSGAAELFRRALSLSEADPASSAALAARLERIYAKLGKPRERCDMLEIQARLSTDPPARRAAFRELAKVAFEETHDADRAASAYQRWLAESPADLEFLDGLVSVIEGGARTGELVLALTQRSALLPAEEARADLVRAAGLQAAELRDTAAAIASWSKIETTFGANEETFDALSALYTESGSFTDLAALYERTALAASPEQRGDLYRMLGDLHRDRTGQPMKALDAYARAGDLGRATTIGDRIADRGARRAFAEELLRLCERAFGAGATPHVTDAAKWAVQSLVAGHREDGNHEQVVDTLLRSASLPLGRAEQRRMKRDAAFIAADKLGDAERALSVLGQLYSEDPSDELAAQSISRYARLLEEAGRSLDLARLWERHAVVRTEAGDRAGAAALWARAAGIHERLSDVDGALAAHRNGAAVGGEDSLEALARLYTDRKNHRQAASVLEWLSAQSTREELGERVVRLAQAYLALGDAERARARLEEALTTTMDAAPVRKRLIELYRKEGVWGPLCDLLVEEAERAADDRARLPLIREAAELHVRKRKEPERAVPLLERAVELDPEDPTLPLSLSEVLVASGRFEDAARVLRVRVEQYGHRRPKDRAIVHLYLARVALAAGRRAEALSELDIGAKIDPAHPGILYELGRLALEEGQLTRAERTYRALLLVLRKPDEQAQFAPSRAEIYLDLSEIAAQQGDAERASELVESAFDAALDSSRDAESLEGALRKKGRYELLVRAVETRLSSSSDPAAQARALSDLVVIHSTHVERTAELDGRVKSQARRIHRELDSLGGDEGSWALLSGIYEWLGDPESEADVLERRVQAFLAGAEGRDLGPVLRLIEFRLRDPRSREEAARIAEQALDRGADAETLWSLLHAASGGISRDETTLRVLERIARDSGREGQLSEVIALRTEAGWVPAETLREAVQHVRERKERSLELRLLQGAERHSVERYAPGDRAWVRERLGRLLLEEGRSVEARGLLEQAVNDLASPAREALAIEVATAASGDPDDLARAARLYELVLAVQPSNRAAWEPLLELHRRSGDRTRLLSLIHATAPLVESAADRGRLRLEEATTMLADPAREEDAIGLLHEVVAEHPAMREAAETLTSLLESKGRFDELGVLLERDIDAARSQGDGARVEAASSKLGELLERQGHTERALSTFRGVLDWNPSSRDALRAIVRLEEARGSAPGVLADAIEPLVPLEEGEAMSVLARRLVELRLEDGDALGADRALQIAYAANPRDQGLRERLLARRLELSDWMGAGQVLQHAAAAEPGDAALLFRAVEAYERAGDLKQAIQAITEATVRGPSNVDLYLERARLHRELGDAEGVLEDLEAAHALGGGRLTDLAAALEAVLSKAEGRARTERTLRLVDVLEELGETTHAREHLVRLVKQEPKHREALRRLASLASAEARWDEAAATYRRLIPLEEGAAMVTAALDLADACEHIGRLYDARGGLERALEAAPGDAALRARLANLYEVTNAHRELSELLLAQARSESEVAARSDLLLRAATLLFEKEHDAARAVDVLGEVRRLAPESIPAAVLYARAQAALGRRDDALAALEAVVASHRGRRTRDLSAVYREIGSFHIEAGDLKRALEAMNKAFELDLKNGDLAMQLGALALDLGDLETAQKAFRSVTMMKTRKDGGAEGASAESKAVAYYSLSRVAQDQGDFRRARLMASKALTENPAHAEAQALLKDLRVG